MKKGTKKEQLKHKQSESAGRSQGPSAVDPAKLSKFEQAMRDEVIPEIVKVVEKRRELAEKSRRWQLKC